MNSEINTITGKQQNTAVVETNKNAVLSPARLTGPQVSEMLGYTEKDINILVNANHLKPLHKSDDGIIRKWKFATVMVQEISSDVRWLERAECILHHWHDTQKKGAVL